MILNALRHNIVLVQSNFLFRQVFVLDFPPRLNLDGNWQDAMRQEFHREAALMGMFIKTLNYTVLAQLIAYISYDSFCFLDLQ